MIEIARNLRKRMTDAEKFLWELLRDRQLNNLKFRRQHPL
jgi:uroporphyrinogen-III synthase